MHYRITYNRPHNLVYTWIIGGFSRGIIREGGFFLFDVSTIIPLGDDYYEVMVDATKIDKLREELRGLTYTPFDKKSTPVRKKGEHGALEIMLNSYRSANLREEPRKLAESRMKELEKGLVSKNHHSSTAKPEDRDSWLPTCRQHRWRS